VVGTLLAGVLIGQLHISVPPLVKIVFFDLFLFATGYKVGPQFFRGLGKSAVPQVALTVVLCVTALLAALLATKILGYDTGTAAGLVAGAFTESTVIGTAGEAITRLGLAESETTRLLNNIPVAYAVTYLVGTSAAVWFLSHLGPRMLGVELEAEGRKLEQALSGGATKESGIRSAYREWDVRAFDWPTGGSAAPWPSSSAHSGPTGCSSSGSTAGGTFSRRSRLRFLPPAILSRSPPGAVSWRAERPSGRRSKIVRSSTFPSRRATWS
jgi:hypothetical protein